MDEIGVVSLETVRKAARLAVYMAIMMQEKIQNPATSIRVDVARGSKLSPEDNKNKKKRRRK